MKNSTNQKKSNSKSTSRASQLTTGSTPTKSGRSKMQKNYPVRAQIVPLPSVYRKLEDHTALRLRTSRNIVNTATGFASQALVLTPASITTPNYFGLGDLFPMLQGMANQYARFMLTRYVVQLVPTSPATSGGYVAVNFEPDEASTTGPASVLADVVSSLHSDVAQVTEIAGIQCNVSDYFNDWKSSTIAGNVDATHHAGVTQIWCSNSQSNTTGVALLQIEVDIHFCGFRYK